MKAKTYELITNKNIKGIVFQVGDKNYKPILDITSPAAKRYAKKINFEYKLFNTEEDFDRHPSWYKIYVLRNLLKEYDWTFLLDGDALILDHNALNIESEIINTKYHIHACSDGVGDELHNFNSGVMFFKSSPLTRHFTDNVIGSKLTTFHFKRNWEQNAMHHEIHQNNKLYNGKIKIHASNLFNHDGEFIYHPALSSDFEKIKMLKNRITCPPCAE